MALSTTARSTPVGDMLDYQQGALIAFAADPDVSLWELEVQPIGLDGGDSINITTHHNTTYVTKGAGTLIDVPDVTQKFGYDPAVFDQLLALINVEGAITIHYPNNDTEDFFGYLKSVVKSTLVKNSREIPTVDCVIVCTNVDTSDSSETGPNYKTSAGTD